MVGKAERNEIDYLTSSHTHGAQNSKYIGITTDALDAKRFAHQKMSHLKKKEYKAELRGKEW